MNYLTLLRSLALLALGMPLAVWAQSGAYPGYLLDASGHFVRSSTPGECWHTSQWTPALAVEPCDPVDRVRQIAPPPGPVAQAPAPTPAPPPRAIPVPVPQKISISADTLFAFDKSVLTPKGKEVLDDVARQLNNVQATTVYITGHTDRIGSKAYNQKLSLRRAVAVRDYLAAGGASTARMDVKGMGEEMPVTEASTCARTKGAKLIACLQPDRRVEVEFEGLAATPQN